MRMSGGTLEVMLVNAQGIKKGDFFSKTDAYAVVYCGSQNHTSNVARNQGSNPTWNQRFVFSVENGTREITLKIMDEDLFTADDELGIVTVPLEPVFQAGKTSTMSYNVVQKNGKFKGEVKLSLAFTPKKQYTDSLHGGPSYHAHESQGSSRYGQGSRVDGPYGSQSGGGWNQGAY